MAPRAIKGNIKMISAWHCGKITRTQSATKATDTAHKLTFSARRRCGKFVFQITHQLFIMVINAELFGRALAGGYFHLN